MANIDMVNILKNLDNKKREHFLRSYVLTEPGIEEIQNVILQYPEIVRYAYESGAAFFATFVSKYGTIPGVGNIIESVVDPNTIIINNTNVEAYLLCPSIKGKLLEYRYDEVIDSLKDTWIDFLDPQVYKILEDNIKQDETFVLGVDGSNMDNIFDGDDMARVKLVRSFKNNKEATLEYLKRYSSSLKGILTKEIINEYIDNNHDFLIDEDNVDLVVAQPYLIAVSLRNDPEYTFRKIEECRIYLYGISPRDIIEVLGPNFVIDTNSARLVKIWPEVAEVSLKNDYAQTLSVLSDMSQSGLTNSRAYDLYRTIKPILQSNNFVLSVSTLNLLHLSPGIADISMENDPYTTVVTLAKGRHTREFREYLLNLDVEEILTSKPGFVIDSDLYMSFKSLVSNDVMTRIIRKSFRNDPFATLISGEHIWDYLDIDNNKEIIKKILVENVDRLHPSYDARKALTSLVNKRPSVIREILKDNYVEGLKLLASCDVSKFESITSAFIKDELKNKGYVVGYKDNNPYLVDLMFEVSLKNDFVKTMKHGIHELFVLEDFVKEKVTMFPSTVRKLMVEGITQNDIKFNSTIREFISQDNDILVQALHQNYDRTIANMAKGDRNTQLRINNPEAMAAIYNILRSNNFTFTKETGGLLFLSPLFLIAALENDYYGTRSFLMNSKLPINDVEINDEQASKIVSILWNSGQDEELFYRLLSRTPSLMVRRLEKNFDKLMEEVERNDRPLAMMDKASSEKVMEKLISISETRKVDLSKYPKFVSIIAWGIFGDEKKKKNGQTEKYMKFLIDHGAPLAYIPFESLEQIAPYLESKEVEELYEKIYFNQSYVYSKEDEIRLLKCLGSKFDSIEDELAYLQSISKTKKDLSLTQMLALAFFAKKDQYKKGIENCKVDTYVYGPSKTNLGAYGGSKLRLYNGHDESIHGMVETIIHENNHAKQKIDITTLDITSDPDIILYTKDEIIRTVLRNYCHFDYYMENYWAISFEYDTELKSQMEALKVLRLEGELLHKGEDVSTLVDRESLTRFGAERNKYSLTAHRSFDGQDYLLDDLFEYCLNICVRTGIIDIEELMKQYPIIKYEYDISSSPVKKYDVKELVSSYKQANELDKEVYKSIFRCRLDPLYNSSYMEDIDLFMETIKGDEELNGLLEEILDELNDEYRMFVKGNEVFVSKYLGIAEKIIESDKRISTEEFKRKIS